MKAAGTRTKTAAPGHSRTRGAGETFALNVAVVYEDCPSRERVSGLCERVTRSLGRCAFHLRFWSFADLDGTPAFPEAVAAAVEADVIIVSLRAAETLSPCFCKWIAAWLPRRRRQDGTLIALVEATGQQGAALESVQTHLRGVAEEGRLEFLLREHAAPRDWI